MIGYARVQKKKNEKTLLTQPEAFWLVRTYKHLKFDSTQPTYTFNADLACIKNCSRCDSSASNFYFHHNSFSLLYLSNFLPHHICYFIYYLSSKTSYIIWPTFSSPALLNHSLTLSCHAFPCSQLRPLHKTSHYSSKPAVLLRSSHSLSMILGVPQWTNLQEEQQHRHLHL